MIGAKKASSGGYALPYLLSAELQLFVDYAVKQGLLNLPYLL